ncbi:MAG: SUMF1/EgtB/PvdO family nonheme iron enzyme [Rhodobacterales bacterium]|nr:SUMF1/EgtB/PvdO family nonheme iron enzyme [Rhodobacterales bacterium]
MASNLVASLENAVSLPVAERASALIVIGQSLLDGEANGASGNLSAQVAGHLAALLEDHGGSGKDRMSIGEMLGALGDPRLLTPNDAGYWVTVTSDDDDIHIGQYPVTNAEFQKWVDKGGYDNRAAWSDDGWAWLQDCDDPWPVRATSDGSAPFVVSNQPIVGVSWFEAEAYANAHSARLPRADERVWVIRGHERRPYPWGSPFGEGNANTREEVLGRPCAVGLYSRDRTPEGVCDLAGNAGEWTTDVVGNDRLIHPGAWDQPSLAAWAKALSIEAPSARWAGLGFRLAKD